MTIREQMKDIVHTAGKIEETELLFKIGTVTLDMFEAPNMPLDKVCKEFLSMIYMLDNCNPHRDFILKGYGEYVLTDKHTNFPADFRKYALLMIIQNEKTADFE